MYVCIYIYIYIYIYIALEPNKYDEYYEGLYDLYQNDSDHCGITKNMISLSQKCF